MKVEIDVAEKLESIDKTLAEIKVEIALLKMKSGIWGLIGASIPIVTMLAFELVKGR